MNVKIDRFLNGITQAFMAPRGFLDSPEGLESTRDMLSVGYNCVALVVNQFQDSVHSNHILADNVHTPEDATVERHVARLHQAGVSVMLKPMVEPLDSIWRGCISRQKGNIIAETHTDNITPWFKSYREFILRYAELAERTNCEILCIGCELDGMECHCAEWRETIRQVRKCYSGIVTYNLTMDITTGNEDRRWFSDLDLVGISGYFKAGPKGKTSTLNEMLAGWAPYRNRLEAFSKWIGRPLFFAETGTRPVVGAAGITGDFADGALVYSEQEQADYYTSMVETLAHEPWFYGIVWWKHDEHQHRPNYYLSDGHYVGCEPAPMMRQRISEWCRAPQPQKNPILPMSE